MEGASRFAPHLSGCYADSAPSADALATEAAMRQADWERQIASLDQREVELHQTQLRLVREQTITFVRDLGRVQDEVVCLRSGYDAVLRELRSDIDARQGQTRELIEAGDRALQSRVAALERASAQQREELAAAADRLRSADSFAAEFHEEAFLRDSRFQAELDRRIDHVRALAEQEREVMQGKLTDLVALQAEAASAAQDSEAQHSALGDRLDRLEQKVQQSQALKQCARLEAEVRELRAALADERCIGEDRGHRVVALEMQHAAAQELSGQSAYALKRINELEQRVGEMAEQERTEAERWTRRVEQLGGKVSEHSSQLLSLVGLPERCSQIEMALDEAGDKNREDMAATSTRVEQMAERLADFERRGPMLQEVQQAVQAEGSSCARLAGEVQRLEAAMHDVIGRRSTELELIRAAEAKVEEMETVQSKLELLPARIQALEQNPRDWAKEVASIGAQHAALRERVDDLARRWRGHPRGGRVCSVEVRLEDVERIASQVAEALVSPLRAGVEEALGRIVAWEQRQEADLTEARRPQTSLRDRSEHLDAYVGKARELPGSSTSSTASQKLEEPVLRMQLAHISEQLAQLGAAEERLSSVEALVTELSASFGEEFDRLRAAQQGASALVSKGGAEGAQLGEQAARAERGLSAVSERVGRVEGLLEDLVGAGGRLQQLEAMAHQDLGAIRSMIDEQHAALASSTAELQACSLREQRLAERLVGVESAIAGLEARPQVGGLLPVTPTTALATAARSTSVCSCALGSASTLGPEGLAERSAPRSAAAPAAIGEPRTPAATRPPVVSGGSLLLPMPMAAPSVTTVVAPKAMAMRQRSTPAVAVAGPVLMQQHVVHRFVTMPAAPRGSITLPVQQVPTTPPMSLFDQLDTDHSGTISREEFNRLMRKP